MRRTRDLKKLKRCGSARLSRLRAVAESALGRTAPSADAERAIAYCCVELHNFWTIFSRSLYLSVVLGARDRYGRQVVCANYTGDATISEALWPAVRRCRGRKNPKETWSWSDEPRWFETASLLNALDEVRADNYDQVSASLSVPSVGVYESLGAFRNFYCHRSQGTAELVAGEAARLGVSPALRAGDILSQRTRPAEGTRPLPLLLAWVDEVRVTVELCI